MASRAIVIGIDAYPTQPLSSAVNDAKAFAAALVETGLIKENEIELFTAPGTGANYADIRSSLKAVCQSENSLDRFFFFFAGHGLLAFSDPAHTRAGTALLAADADPAGFEEDSQNVIDFEDLRDKLQLTGPKEQFLFVDACRDLAYEKHPDVKGLGFATGKAGATRSQVTIFAVSPLGKAVGSKGGMGVMTEHLIDALRAKGIAADFESRRDKFVVTAQSAHAYVREKVLAAVSAEPMYLRKYALPEIQHRGPESEPLRILPDLPPAPLTIHIQPDSAGPPATQVEIALRRYRLDPDCFPPRSNHATVLLPPERYSVIVTSTAGKPHPERAVVDLRTTNQHIVSILAGTPPGDFTPLVSASAPPEPEGGGLPSPAPRGPDFKAGRLGWIGGLPEPGPRPTTGTLEAQSIDVGVTIRAVGLDPPYPVHEAVTKLSAQVTPGPYRVTFRLGADVFGLRDVYVRREEKVVVSPTVAGTPLVREALSLSGVESATIPSETIGPMQAAVLPTLLPLLGLKPFDTENTFFRRATSLVPKLKITIERPISMVVAFDGDWSESARKLIGDVVIFQCQRFDGERLGSPRMLTPLGGLNSFGLWQPGQGFDRIGMATFEAPANSFVLSIESPQMGSIQIATANLPQRVTVIGLILRPDGSFDLSQSLLRRPGIDYQAEPVSYIPYAKMVRQLQLGQQLYKSNELFKGRGLDVIDALLYAKWTDPLLGCMGFFSGLREPGYELSSLQIAATNMLLHFRELPDARVVALVQGLEISTPVTATMGGSPPMPEPEFAANEVPVLAESLHALVPRMERLRHPPEHLLDLSRQIVPGQPWTMKWS